jgi:hypothetical protein
MFLSCTTNELIIVKQDGTAVLRTDFIDFNSDTGEINNLDSFKLKLMSREVVRNVEFSPMGVLIHVQNVDSVMNFTDVFNKNYFNFKMSSDTLLMIQTSDVFPFKYAGFKECCNLHLEIIPDQIIENVTTINKRVKWNEKKNKVTIYLSNDAMRENETQLDIKIRLGKTLSSDT